MKRTVMLLFLSELLLCFASALPLCQAQVARYPRDAYLPLKIEMIYGYTMNFSLNVKVGILGSSWTETKSNTYMMFEVKESRDSFTVTFEIRYPQPVEQIVTVKFTEGKRSPIVEFIHYTDGMMDPQATSREPPSTYIHRVYNIRTVAEPTDPNEIARIVDLQHEKREQQLRDEVKSAREEVKALRADLRFRDVAWVILFACFVVVVIWAVTVTRRR